MTAPSPRDREIALLPCPFCGGAASFEEIKRSPEVSNWTVGCDERNDDDEILCYGYQSLTTFATKKEAAAAWNKRDARALAAARTEGMEAAAKCAEQFGDRILHMWERPGGPPGNGYRALRGADVAAAIRALAQEPQP